MGNLQQYSDHVRVILDAQPKAEKEAWMQFGDAESRQSLKYSPTSLTRLSQLETAADKQLFSYSLYLKRNADWNLANKYGSSFLNLENQVAFLQYFANIERALSYTYFSLYASLAKIDGLPSCYASSHQYGKPPFFLKMDEPSVYTLPLTGTDEPAYLSKRINVLSEPAYHKALTAAPHQTSQTIQVNHTKTKRLTAEAFHLRETAHIAHATDMKVINLLDYYLRENNIGLLRNNPSNQHRNQSLFLFSLFDNRTFLLESINRNPNILLVVLDLVKKGMAVNGVEGSNEIDEHGVFFVKIYALLTNYLQDFTLPEAVKPQYVTASAELEAQSGKLVVVKYPKKRDESKRLSPMSPMVIKEQQHHLEGWKSLISGTQIFKGKAAELSVEVVADFLTSQGFMKTFPLPDNKKDPVAEKAKADMAAKCMKRVKDFFRLSNPGHSSDAYAKQREVITRVLTAKAITDCALPVQCQAFQAYPALAILKKGAANYDDCVYLNIISGEFSFGIGFKEVELPDEVLNNPVVKDYFGNRNIKGLGHVCPKTSDKGLEAKFTVESVAYTLKVSVDGNSSTLCKRVKVNNNFIELELQGKKDVTVAPSPLRSDVRFVWSTVNNLSRDSFQPAAHLIECGDPRHTLFVQSESHYDFVQFECGEYRSVGYRVGHIKNSFPLDSAAFFEVALLNIEHADHILIKKPNKDVDEKQAELIYELPRLGLSFTYDSKKAELYWSDNPQYKLVTTQAQAIPHYTGALYLANKDDGVVSALFPIYPLKKEKTLQSTLNYVLIPDRNNKNTFGKGLFNYQVGTYIQCKVHQNGDVTADSAQDYLYLAYLYLANNKFEKALACFEKCRRNAPLTGTVNELSILREILNYDAVPDSAYDEAPITTVRTPKQLAVRMAAGAFLAEFYQTNAAIHSESGLSLSKEATKIRVDAFRTYFRKELGGDLNRLYRLYSAAENNIPVSMRLPEREKPYYSRHIQGDGVKPKHNANAYEAARLNKGQALKRLQILQKKAHLTEAEQKERSALPQTIEQGSRIEVAKTSYSTRNVSCSMSLAGLSDTLRDAFFKMRDFYDLDEKIETVTVAHNLSITLKVEAKKTLTPEIEKINESVRTLQAPDVFIQQYNLMNHPKPDYHSALVIYQLARDENTSEATRDQMKAFLQNIISYYYATITHIENADDGQYKASRERMIKDFKSSVPEPDFCFDILKILASNDPTQFPQIEKYIETQENIERAFPKTHPLKPIDWKTALNNRYTGSDHYYKDQVLSEIGGLFVNIPLSDAIVSMANAVEKYNNPRQSIGSYNERLHNQAMLHAAKECLKILKECWIEQYKDRNAKRIVDEALRADFVRCADRSQVDAVSYTVRDVSSRNEFAKFASQAKKAKAPYVDTAIPFTSSLKDLCLLAGIENLRDFYGDYKQAESHDLATPSADLFEVKPTDSAYRKRSKESYNADYREGEKYNLRIEQMKAVSIKHLGHDSVRQQLKSELGLILSAEATERKSLLLHDANEVFASEAERLDTAAAIQGKQRTTLGIPELMTLFLHNDIELYREKTKLSDPQIKKLHNDVGEYLCRATEYQHIERVIKAITDIEALKAKPLYDQDEYQTLLQKLGTQLTAKRAYTWQDFPQALVFEYYEDMMVRPEQYQLLQSLLNKDGTGNFNNVILQLIMGGGKSKLISPLALVCSAEGHNLVVYDVPKPLLETNYADVKDTLKRLFGVEAHKFEFSRHHTHTSDDLRRMLASMKLWMQNREVVVCSGSSIQSLELKWTETLRNLQACKPDERSEFLARLRCLEEIDTILVHHTDIICDEVDLRLSRNQALIYSAGSEIFIPKDNVDYVVDFYQWIAHKSFTFNGQNGEAEKSYTFLQLINHEAPIPRDAQWDAFFAQVVDELIADPQSPLAGLINGLNKTDCVTLKRWLYTNLATENTVTQDREEGFAQEVEALLKKIKIDKALFSRTSFYKHILSNLFHTLIPKSFNFHYGFIEPPKEQLLSLIETVDKATAHQRGWDYAASQIVMPYEGVRAPKIGSKYNPEEKLVLTCQAHLQHNQPMTFELFTLLMKELYQRAEAECAAQLNARAKGLNAVILKLDETDAGELFYRLLGKGHDTDEDPIKLVDFEFDESNLEVVLAMYRKRYGQLKHHSELCLEAIRRHVLGFITYDTQSIRSNPYAYVESTHSFRGLTGTPHNAEEYHYRLSFDKSPSFGTDGRTLNKIISKHPEIFEIESLKLVDFLNISFEKHGEHAKKIRSIIDNGLFKDYKNLQAAQEIAAFFKDHKNPGGIKWVLYFDENQILSAIEVANPHNIKKIGSSSPTNIAAKLSGCAPEHRFSYYDQPHTTGADIHQAFDTEALETFGILSSLRDVLQATMRLRDFSKAQKVIFIIGKVLTDMFPGKTWSTKNILEFVFENALKKQAENNYVGALEQYDAIIRQAIKQMIKAESDIAKKEAMFCDIAEGTFVFPEEIDPGKKFSHVEYYDRTQTLLEDAKQAAESKLKSFVKKFSLTMPDSVKHSLDKVHQNALERTEDMAKTTAKMNDLGSELELQIETEVEKQQVQEKQKQVQLEEKFDAQQLNINAQAIRPKILNFTAPQLADFNFCESAVLPVVEGVGTPLYSLDAMAEERLFFEPAYKSLDRFKFDSSILISDMASSVCSNAGTGKPMGAFTGMQIPVQVLYSYAVGELLAVIVTDDEAAHLMKVMSAPEFAAALPDNKAMWLERPSGKPKCIEVHASLVQEALKNPEAADDLKQKQGAIWEQVNFLCGNWDVLNQKIRDTKDMHWFQRELDKKAALLGALSDTISQNHKTDFDQFKQHLSELKDKAAPSFLLRPTIYVNYADLKSDAGLRLLASLVNIKNDEVQTKASMPPFSIHVISSSETLDDLKQFSRAQGKTINFDRIKNMRFSVVDAAEKINFVKQNITREDKDQVNVLVDSDAAFINAFYDPNNLQGMSIKSAKCLVRLPIAGHMGISYAQHLIETYQIDRSERKFQTLYKLEQMNDDLRNGRKNAAFDGVTYLNRHDAKLYYPNLEAMYSDRRKASEKEDSWIRRFPRNSNRALQLALLQQVEQLSLGAVVNLDEDQIGLKRAAAIGTYLAIIAEIDGEPKNRFSKESDLRKLCVEKLAEFDIHYEVLSDQDYSNYTNAVSVFFKKYDAINRHFLSYKDRFSKTRPQTFGVEFTRALAHIEKGKDYDAIVAIQKNPKMKRHVDAKNNDLLLAALAATKSDENHIKLSGQRMIRFLILHDFKLRAEHYAIQNLDRIADSLSDEEYAYFVTHADKQLLPNHLPHDATIAGKAAKYDQIAKVHRNNRMRKILYAVGFVAAAVIIAAGVGAAIYFTAGLAAPIIPALALGLAGKIGLLTGISFGISAALTTAIWSVSVLRFKVLKAQVIVDSHMMDDDATPSTSMVMDTNLLAGEPGWYAALGRTQPSAMVPRQATASTLQNRHDGASLAP